MQSKARESKTELRWRIDLLGGLRARCGDREITRFSTQKTAVLLAYLAYYPQRPHPRDALVDLLWPEITPDAARGSFRVALHALRHQLEPPEAAGSVLIADRQSVSLNPETVTTDVAQMRDALDAARTCAHTEERIEHLQRAITLYEGALLPGYDEEWILTERQYLQERYLGALHEQALALEESGQLDQALEVARRVIGVDPLREEAHFDVMRLYAAAGQPTAALRQFQELERVLREELGEAPSETSRVWAQELRNSARSVGARQRPAAVDAQAATRDDSPPTTHRRSPEAAGAETWASHASDTDTPPAIPVAGGASLGGDARSSTVAGEAPPCRLPAPHTRFLAREEELDWITETLRDPEVRLLTLTGPGGTGKTRLAIAAAGRWAQARAGAVWFVPLADVAPAPSAAGATATGPETGLDGMQDRIIDMIAEVLDLSWSAKTTSLDQVAEVLGRQPSLLVLDNFEHLVEGAMLVHRLLERVPTLRCLVTSRQHLDLSGEQEFPVAPLPTPGSGIQAFRRSGVQEAMRGADVGLAPNARTPELLMQFAAVQLFVDRARAVSPAFQISAENAEAIAAVCDRLEGLPLALELAAAWARTLTPEQILDRLSHRLELLVGNRRDLSPRHRSLRAAMEWSYQLLSPALRHFFVQLSVFRGGWTVEAAEAVSEERRTLEYLRQLQECSLVMVEEAGRTMRHRLLETVREFAVEQLEPAEQQSLARRHARFFLASAEQSDGDEAQRMQQIEREYDNIRAALDWSVQGLPPGVAWDQSDAELGLALGCALEMFWVSRCHVGEGLRYLTALLERPGPRRSLIRAHALTLAGRFTLFQEGHNSPAARALLEESLSMARELDEKPLAARILVSLADAARTQHSNEASRALYGEALALYREMDQSLGMATVLASLAGTYDEEDPLRSKALYEESVAVFRTAGSQSGLAWALNHFASNCHRRGDYAPARALSDESLSVFRQLGERIGLASSLRVRGMLALALGDLEAARRCFDEVWQICYEVGGLPNTANALNYLGDAALVEGDTESAAELYERALPLARTKEDPLQTGLALLGLGRVALRRGDGREAAVRFRETFSMRRDEPEIWHTLLCVEGLAAAALLIAREKPTGVAPRTAPAAGMLHAARLFGGVQAVRERLGAVRHPHEIREFEAWIATLRRSLGDAEFAAAWEAGRALPWDATVSCAIEASPG